MAEIDTALKLMEENNDKNFVNRAKLFARKAKIF